MAEEEGGLTPEEVKILRETLGGRPRSLLFPVMMIVVNLGIMIVAVLAALASGHLAVPYLSLPLKLVVGMMICGVGLGTGIIYAAIIRNGVEAISKAIRVIREIRNRT